MILGFASALWNTGTISYIQEYFSKRKGIADGFYAAVLQAPSLFVGVVMEPVTKQYGVRSTFVAAAVCEIVGVIILLLFNRWNHRLVASIQNLGCRAKYAGGGNSGGQT